MKVETISALHKKPSTKLQKAKSDDRITRLCETLDLIASEAQHHHSCYRDYTRAITVESLSEDVEHCYTEVQTLLKDSTDDIFQVLFDYIREAHIDEGKVANVECFMMKLDDILRQSVGSKEQDDKSFKK